MAVSPYRHRPRRLPMPSRADLVPGEAGHVLRPADAVINVRDIPRRAQIGRFDHAPAFPQGLPGAASIIPYGAIGRRHDGTVVRMDVAVAQAHEPAGGVCGAAATSGVMGTGSACQMWRP